METHGSVSEQKDSVRIRGCARNISRIPPVPRVLRCVMLSVAFVGVLIGPPLLNSGEFPSSEEFSGTSIYVDPQNPRAFDGNLGSRARPVLTLSRAVLLARGNVRQGLATKIVLGDGVYRESISLEGLGGGGPLIIEAANRGQAIITGSDRWTDWTRIDADLYAHGWDQHWGLVPYPPGWQPVTLQPITRRREMVFTDGRLLQQALSMPELRAQPAGFFVSESERRIYVRLGVRRPDLEVTTRATLLAGDRVQHLVLRGLVFEHAANPIDKGAVTLDGCDQVVIEDCDFRWNNWTGLAISSSRNVTAVRNRANHNGGSGMTLYRINNVNFQDNETSYNNWRGALGGFIGWAVAGIKSLRIHDGSYRNHHAHGNQATGFWLDFDCANVAVNDGSFCHNASHGVFIEGSQGPITVRDSVICNNVQGLVIANSPDVTLERNVLFQNAKVQLLIGGEAGGRAVTDWETNRHFVLDTARLILKHNAVVSENEELLVLTRLTPGQTRLLLSTIVSKKNVWFNPSTRRLFQIAGEQLDLALWKRVSGQDSDSQFADPLFADPAHDNFQLLPGSPLASEDYGIK